MYLNFFGLFSAPFSIAPDPGFLYLTEKHQEALAHLLYSTTQKGGFILLTGEIGTGKTTLCRHFLKVVPEQFQTAFIFNPKISSKELLATICDEFGIERPARTASIKQLTDLINARLLDIHARGRNALLVIDEAQNLSMEVLEQVRLLTNLETTEHKLLQIILIGQPQLRTMLARDELRQLSQRILARYHLEPLSMQETACYIRHRLVTSGSSRKAADAMFPAPVLKEIHKSTKGVPRLVNVLCDRALLGAYVENSHAVSRRIVRNAVREVFGDEKAVRPPFFSGWRPAALAACLALAAGGLALYPFPPDTASDAALISGKEATSGSKAAAAPVVSLAAVSGPALIPSRLSSSGSEPAAYRSLLKLWGVPGGFPEGAPDEKEACLAANDQHLRCFSATNRNWHQFRLFGLPAVLTLRDVDRNEFHAVIESATSDQAKLIVGGKPVTVSLGQLAFYWTGRFTLLWRPPAGFLTDAELTQKALNALMKAPPPWLFELLGASESANVPLRQLVANFQKSAGIQSDGIIGAQTLMMLSRAAGNSPVLQANQ